MAELILLLVAVALLLVTITGSYKKRLESVPFLLTARVLIAGAVIFYGMANDQVQPHHFIVIALVIAWLIYDTVLRVIRIKSTT